MGIKGFLRRTGTKAADTVAKLSVLSPEQLDQMAVKRNEYLTQIPDLTDGAAEELTRRLMAAAGIEIYKEYLDHLDDLYTPVQKDAEYDNSFKPAYNIRYFNITKWVTDKRENSIEKLINVYKVLSDEDCNIALVFHRRMEKTEVYLAVVNTGNASDNVTVDNFRIRIAEAIRGNFPGSEWTDKDCVGVIPCLNNSFPYSVASASNIPGEKSEKFISQTIEKLLDGIIPDSPSREYTLILLATPIRDIEERKLHLEELYTALAPYAGWQTSFTYTESDSTNAMATFGLNAGVSAGLQSSGTISQANTQGTTDSTGTTTTDSTSDSTSDAKGVSETDSTSSSTSYSEGESSSIGSSTTSSTGTSHGIGENLSEAVSKSNTDTAGGNIEVGNIASPVRGGANYSHGYTRGTTTTVGTSTIDTISETVAKGMTKTAGKTVSQTIGENVGKAIGTTATKTIANTVGHAVANTLGRAVTNSTTIGAALTKGVNLGGNFGANFARSSNVSATVGKNEGIQQSFTNYSIKHTLEILEQQMKRLEQSTALGMWDFAAYVMSEDQNVASNVAHSYLALTQGETSYLSQTAVNLWRGDMGELSAHAKEICNYLRELRHPIFGLSPAIIPFDEQGNLQNLDYLSYPALVTAATSLSGKELAYSLNFPRKSLAGFPVIECAEFGRNIVSYYNDDCSRKLHLGQIFHMNHSEQTPVILSRDSLSAHAFITGSTGSGKSNTVYKLLDEAMEQGVKFLVIEPAKGEYKNVFGNDADVFVFGTNPYTCPLLRLDPFSFPENIHVFEHMDRLIEIFNVCWPMYAAMPAVLKSAIEKSYQACGWDLMRSTNKYGERIFPGFIDVTNNIREIIDTSDYDTENKGAYKGSLLTRLQSLTTGINSTIFVTDEVTPHELFDRNVIIDLSRIGSSETKALIMGMLVLKLQEYRMTSSGVMNTNLRHITVLEEAHNLLRRTSIAQSSESANLTGKSVEMLSNAIAEMRTYGEGFVIVDQAPGLLDMSAIRNTNTKIILRLPDQGDRELVGHAANLNDDQIKELAKLPRGVAAVYQNEWIQPVLCKVDYFPADPKPYTYTPGEDIFRDRENDVARESLLNCIMEKSLQEPWSREDIEKLKRMILRSRMDSQVKVDFMNYLLSNSGEAVKTLRKLIYDFLSAKEAIESAAKYDDISMWVSTVVEQLKPSIKRYSSQQINLAFILLLYEQTIRDDSYNDVLCRYMEEYQTEGSVY